MTMRYHWGLGVGHTYSHHRDVRSQQYSSPIIAEGPEVIQGEILQPGHVDAVATADIHTQQHLDPIIVEDPIIRQEIPNLDHLDGVPAADIHPQPHPVPVSSGIDQQERNELDHRRTVSSKCG